MLHNFWLTNFWLLFAADVGGVSLKISYKKWSNSQLKICNTVVILDAVKKKLALSKIIWTSTKYFGPSPNLFWIVLILNHWKIRHYCWLEFSIGKAFRFCEKQWTCLLAVGQKLKEILCHCQKAHLLKFIYLKNLYSLAVIEYRHFFLIFIIRPNLKYLQILSRLYLSSC